jgi:hypothetical protein
VRRHAKASSADHSALRGYVALAVGMGILLILAMATAAPALAGTKATHVFQSSFKAFAGEFDNVTGLAVDESTGDVYAAASIHDAGDVIRKFDASGTPSAFASSELPPGTTELDGSSSTAGAFPQGNIHIAVDNSGGATQGNIYVLQPGFSSFHPPGVVAFAPNGEFLWEEGEELGRTCGIATDTAGHVWVRVQSGEEGINAGKIVEYSAAGTFMSAVFPDDLSVMANDCPFAMDSSGSFYLDQTSGINKYGPSGGFETRISPAVVSDLAFDRKTNQILATPPSNTPAIVNVFDQTGTQVDDFGSADFSSNARNIDVNSATGVVYATDGFNVVNIFAPAILPVPDLTFGAPTGVTQTGATLHGTVNPAGESSEYHFEYKRKDETSWTSTPTQSAGSGSSAVAVNAVIAGLTYGTVYDVKLIGTNTVNGKSISVVGSFTSTPIAPVVTTMAVAPRAATSATLNAEIDPSGAATTYYFEYGSDTSYGSSAPVGQDADGGTLRGPKLQSQEISGLVPGLTYHYRVVATNAAGTTPGDDLTFTTRTLAETTQQRGIEMVNSPDKGNQAISKQFELARLGRNSLEQPISADGNQFLWSIEGGAPNSNTGASEPFRSVRGANSWQTTTLAPLADQQYGGGSSAYHLIAESPDFTHSLFAVYNGFAAFEETPVVRMDAQGNQETVTTLPPVLNPQVLFSSLEATDDFSHIVLRPFWLPGDHVYDYGSGTPEMLDLMPDGTPSCGLAKAPVGSNYGDDAFRTYHFIATDDASRVYFGTTDESCSGPPQVYLRNRDTESTTLISGPPSSGALEAARFIRTSANGSVAIFATATKLSADDANEGTDLYRYTEGAGNECLTCEVPNGNADVEPDQVLVSNDLSHIYFQSNQQLIAGKGTPGQLHLYGWHDGVVTFVADVGLRKELSQVVSALLSSDGRVLVFKSSRPLTSDAIGACGVGCMELYRYDSADQSLECVSCRHGGFTGSGLSGAPVAFLAYFMSADGETIEFSTAAPLLSEDVNNTLDVYVWDHGVVHLVTDGVTEFPSGVGAPNPFGVSADGRDVFFSVAAPLTGFEHDGVANLYDARINGGFPRPVPPAHCTEDSCQGPLQAAPGLTSPGSSGLQGPGNATEQQRKARKKAHKKRSHRGKPGGRKQQGSKNHGRHGGRKHG